LTALQAQLEPHMLFNTLAHLRALIKLRPDDAQAMLDELIAYLRATLPMFERESQPLVQEWALVRNYLGIMQARLGERLQWEITHDPALDNVLVPPGSVLTLAENAITHGVEPALRGAAIRLISQLQPDGRVLLRVEDEGAGLPQPFKPGLGLTNTRDRFRQLYGERAVLTLTPLHPDGSGCRSDVLIETPL
jgi:sensor histidine kinase YesM